jgi:hypothetical protein
MHDTPLNNPNIQSNQSSIIVDKLPILEHKIESQIM